MNEVTPWLSHASATNKQATEAMLVVFTNLMKTNYPNDLAIAISCIGLQETAIEASLNCEPLQHSKSCMIEYAKYLGEIRSLRVTNYTMRGSAMPPTCSGSFETCKCP